MNLMMLPDDQRVDKDTFRQIFLDHWDGFKNAYPSYDTTQYEEVVQKMLECGSEMGGYTEYICMQCGQDRRKVCFTCKGSFCLSCAKVYVDEFVEQVSRILVPGVIYRHVVLTVPEQLRRYFYNARHEGSLLSQFMRCGYECLEDVVSTVRRQDIKIGTIIVVQTHGRSGQYNPHLHIIMTNGGINEVKEKWVDLNYFPYEIIHKKWQYHLLKMLEKGDRAGKIQPLINKLWKDYPNGFVAHVKKGNVPESCRGLARYLAKYVACPPIAVRRIMNYDGKHVRYWYKDHETKARKVETVDVYTFIGRMVEHIFPKGFQRVRYYGLQATKTFSKWKEVIKKGLKRIGRVVKGAYQVVEKKTYRQRYKEVSGRDPMVCRYCGGEMDIWRIWHPKYGTIYDEWEEMKAGKYEQKEGRKDRGGCSVWPSPEILQLSLFELQT
jgi:hypothetical protein